MMKDISIRNMELQSQFAIHNSNVLSFQNAKINYSTIPDDTDFAEGWVDS